MMAAASPVRRAVVLGARSQIGFFLLPRLAEGKLEVVALTRGDVAGDQPASAGLIWRQYSPAALTSSIGDCTPVPTVFFLAALPLLPPLIPDFARLGVQRLIAFGTTGRFYKTESADTQERSYIRQLIAAEEEVAGLCERHAIAWTVFRPTLIYGCGRDRNINFIAKFVRRFAFFPLFAGGRGLRQPVHADDLAQACMQALDNRSTYGKAYTLSGGSVVTYREMVEAVFAQLGKPARMLEVPLGLFHATIWLAKKLPRLRGLSTEMATRMGIDMCFDHQAATADFGYRPRPFGLDALSLGISRTK
jgi:nucleoside-diphosphate-sugar epimerase